jgi:hypothetical protein
MAADGAAGGWASRRGTPAVAIQSLAVAHRAYDETSKLARSVMNDLYRGRGIDSQAT